MRATRLKRGDFFADIIVSTHAGEQIWMYVVQRYGSKEILAMGSCHSEDYAISTASDAIDELRGTEQKAVGGATP